MTKKPLLTAVAGGLIGAIVVLFGQWALGHRTTDDMPVAVVNLGALIEAQADGKEITSDIVEKGYQKMHEVGEALAKEGYVVIDASAVINAPEAYYVPYKHTDMSNGKLRDKQRPRSDKYRPK